MPDSTGDAGEREFSRGVRRIAGDLIDGCVAHHGESAAQSRQHEEHCAMLRAMNGLVALCERYESASSAPVGGERERMVDAQVEVWLRELKYDITDDASMRAMSEVDTDKLYTLLGQFARIVHRATPPARPEVSEAPIRYDQRPDGCWAACLAGLARLPHDAIADLLPVDVSEEGWPAYERAVKIALAERGFVHLAYEMQGEGGLVAPRGFAIATGRSSRGVLHSVIVRNGVLWHDPHPSREGLTTLAHYEVLIPSIPEPVGAAALSTPGAKEGE